MMADQLTDDEISKLVDRGAIQPETATALRAHTVESQSQAPQALPPSFTPNRLPDSMEQTLASMLHAPSGPAMPTQMPPSFAPSGPAGAGPNAMAQRTMAPSGPASAGPNVMAQRTMAPSGPAGAAPNAMAQRTFAPSGPAQDEAMLLAALQGQQ